LADVSESHKPTQPLTPSRDIGIGVDIPVSLNVILGRHVRGIASDRDLVGPLPNSDIVDSHVVWQVELFPVDSLPIVGLEH
jgi:hypothetical protein